MFVFRTIDDLRTYLDTIRKEDQTIGFVPTMGALHDGHRSLLEQAKESSDCTVVSIFVNPTQFNHVADFEKYPVDLESDINFLYGAGCHVVFIPDVEGIYPGGTDATGTVDLAGLDETMEGEFRPGHFTGVALVMQRLLEIVSPDLLFMGQKDFQQTVIIRHIIKVLGMHTRFVTCPTIREPDGLAMSSRNVRLAAHIRDRASVIYHTLDTIRHMLGNKTPTELQQWAMKALNIPDFRPEYVAIVDGNTLQPIAAASDADFIVACCSVWAGDVRLIDNMILREPAAD